MATVAVSALILCVYRVDVAPSVTVVLILLSTSVLAYKRYSYGLAQRVSEKPVTTRSQKITLLLTSVIVAVTLIGLSDAAFLVGYYGYVELLVPISFHYQSRVAGTSRAPEVPELVSGIICGFMMAMAVAYALRRMIWPIVTEPLPPATSPPEE
jgi:hypothetical protein